MKLQFSDYQTLVRDCDIALERVLSQKKPNKLTEADLKTFRDLSYRTREMINSVHDDEKFVIPPKFSFTREALLNELHKYNDHFKSLLPDLNPKLTM